ncbi:MAG: sensor histidine kinase, partial [Polyangiales bacterium]
LSVDIAKSIPTMRGDPERLRQVFLNLAENALKFTPTGGKVTLVATSEGGSDAAAEDDVGFVLFAAQPSAVVVRVEDSGIGIPEAERTKIFDPFYQVDGSSTREHGGTGLGLSIVKRLVEMHGGTIAVSANPAAPKLASSASNIRRGASAPGGGSVFTVRFPIRL